MFLEDKYSKRQFVGIIMYIFANFEQLMRYILIMIAFCLGTPFVFSQTYEVGAIYGSTTFVGDVGSTSFVKPGDYLNESKISYGGILKWNRSPRHAFRFTVLSANTYALDTESDDPRRINRGFFFETNITELSLGLEFNFFEWDLHSIERPLFTPYIYTGITYFFADEFILQDERLIKGDKVSNLALPMIFGAKVALTSHWVIAAEFGARYAFSDNLDGSIPDEIYSRTKYPTFGNSNMNDWYIFSGITLTYTFGRKPCYCNF